MKGYGQKLDDRERFVERLTAELTETAYVVALQHGRADSWVDLELGLWRALQKTVHQWLPEDIGGQTAEAGSGSRGEGRRYARMASY
jgi:hypothetical protein